MVLLYFQKVLDTVHHSVLLMELKVVGLINDAVRLFCPYLVDCQWRINYPGVLLLSAEIKLVVPKGPYWDLFYF